ncbi:TPA: glucose 1-dehydrogenase [Candidatus Poribacteria bacterium]|jgi:filamentous hemagglutinin family protein|nr:glucose 1-dehydrogenase [Candidatus Poribacteria bacterium]HIB92203.1 glucose 1-dehydrogenase [Candidatus Poribacteria bacterium]HIM10468.1 glucose 1-dehydrogenase [Candidatus Poribacteria bacterium]HIO77828.1 glucose 1-dehydrogenase [Candidatus Poribacteria bacterium]
MRISDKVAIITGAASGIGRTTAILFAKEGGKVVIADQNEAGGDETVDLIRTDGGQAIFTRVNVTSATDIQGMVKTTIDTYGKLNILVNNAGIAIRLPVVDLPEEDWDRSIDVNLKGIYLGSKYAIPEMIKNDGGAIVNIASIYGLVGGRTRAAYAASKGGVVNLTRSIALDYALYKIRVNCICPGFVNTPLLKNILKTQEEYQALADLHPIGRLGEMLEIAHGVLYLASDESSFVTGIALPIDGGYTAG